MVREKVPTTSGSIVKIGQVSLDPSNVRKHSKKNLEAIKASLKRFGQQKPIVVDSNMIVRAGNGTLQMARELGWDTIEIKVSDLSPDELTAYAIADNRTGELAEWDMEDLEAQLRSLDDELRDIAYDGFEIPDDPAEPREDDDHVPEVDDNPYKVKRGDIWQLGEHRLLCGDSTSEDVAKLMDGNKADMVFTDPPYGMNLDTDYSKIPSIKAEGNKKYRPVKNDDKDFDASFIVDYFTDCSEIFLFGADYYSHSIPKNSGSWVVWDKRVEEKFDAMIGSAFELCWSKNKHKREIARFNNTLFGGDPEARGKVHPTQKPTKLVEWFFDRWGKDKNLIVDLFLGSGSTLIACEKTNRKCYGMEIDEHYCSVIIKRWEDYTGQKARRL
jgi:DNA modification methylase